MSRPSRTLTITQAKKKFLELVDDVQNTHDTVTITKNGIPATVIMSQDEYDRIMETLEILASPAIMKALKKSRQQIQKGRLLTDDEVWS